MQSKVVDQYVDYQNECCLMQYFNHKKYKWNKYKDSQQIFYPDLCDLHLKYKKDVTKKVLHKYNQRKFTLYQTP